MARAVIELSSEIRPFLPYLSRKIEGCAYNPEVGQAAFRQNNMVVVLNPKEINIYKIEDEAAARNIVDWLKKILADMDESF